MSELTTLDERLAEIDERLRALQSGLDEPDASSRVFAESLAPEPPPVASVPIASPSVEPSPLEFAASASEPIPPATPVAPDAFRTSAPRLREAPPPRTSSGPDDPFAELRELTAAHERLLELHRELLGQYAELLERRVGDAASVPLVAGPFADGSALRAFEQDLRGLPSVGEVTIREFLSGDRVAVDVRLAGP